MKVLVVDDSAFMRRAISQMLANDPLIQVVATARNGREAVELAKKLAPDVITMDIEMPEMDGLTALRQIMRDSPTQVLMLSSLTAEGSIVSLQALRIGAADVLAKDVSQVSLSITNIQHDLLTRVRALGQARNRHAKSASPAPAPIEPTLRFRPGQFDLVCIGSSTGGPPVLETILAAVPKTMATPIVIAQHMPELFTRSMAQRLAELTGRPVHHGASGMPVERRGIYISPGGKHTHIRKIGLARWELLVSDQPREALYRPSVDVLLSTGSQVTNGRALGIVLTGIGDDGLLGARELHKHGGTIIAQDEESCVVYGMPKSVTQAGLPAASLNPAQIGALIATLAEPFAAAKAG